MTRLRSLDHDSNRLRVTARYLGGEVDDALEIAEKIEV
jgi:hypothetical protein